MRIKLLLLNIILGIYLVAQAPASYYLTAEGKSTSALKTELSVIISKNYKDVGYGGLYDVYRTSDKNSSGLIWDMYSTCTWEFGKKECGNYSNICDCYNREHSIPQSWFNSQSPMKSDAFHVYPTDGKVNGIRSNLPFGETNAAPIGGKGLGKAGSSSFPGYSGQVFEPVDEYKGDFARTYFYFVTRYQEQIFSFHGEPFISSSKAAAEYPSLTTWAVDLFLKWHRQDPVSQKEIDRNNAIYVHQKNRNPFIDYPELAEYIWGYKKGASWTATVSTDPMLLSPGQASTIDFGNVPYQQPSSHPLDIKAINLVGDLNLAISGSSFTIPVTTISQIDAENGYQLEIGINPQIIGTHKGTLTISGGGIETTTIQLTANSTSKFLALAASEITSEGFTAHWTLSDNATNYNLNVYTYTSSGISSKTLLEENFEADGVLAGWTKKGYTDNFETESIRLASGKKTGEIISPLLDFSSPTVLTISTKSWSGDNSDLFVKVDDTLFTTLTLTNDFQIYVVELPAFTSSSAISFYADKGKRLFIDNIKIATEGVSKEINSVSGYPKNVGNVLSYEVSGLMPDSIYFYKVTPLGNDALESDEIQVKTLVATEMKTIEETPALIAYFAGNTLYVNKLEKGSILTIYSVMGNKIAAINVNSDQISIPFNKKGVFILQTSKDYRITGLRKMIFN